MKHLKTIFACLLMAVLSIGQVWATDPTISWEFKTLQTTSGTQSGITWETGKTGSATATACTAANGLVLYGVASGGGYFQTTTATSGSITNVNIVSTAKKNTPKYTIYCSTDGSTWTEIENNISAGTKDKAITGSYTYLKIANTTAATAQLAVTSITITYSTGGGSSKDDLTDEQLSWSAASANITFGDEPYSLPSLTNSIPVSLTYESTDATVATISNVGVVSVLKAGSTTIKAVFAGNDDYHAKTVSYTLTVAPAPLTPIAGGVVDELIISDLGVTSGSYTAFTDKQASNEGHSDAVYAGKVARNGNSTQYNIQMNTIGTNTSAGREIATSTSGGYAKRVQAIWATQTSNTANRKLTVYGSESAYTGSETVATGTKLGDLTYTSGDTYAYLDIDGDYPYIQIVASGAIYMDQINVTWVSSAAAVAKPAISGDENFLTSTEVSITCATDGATIYYTTNGSDPKTVGTEYSGPFSLTESATVHAIANYGSDWSEPASKTFTKITPITVAAAIAAIPNKDDVVDNQYVSGIVCTAGTSVSSGKMTYYISDDGSETNRLQIYKGKNVGNTNFTAATDLAIGDRVTVFGQLKNFNNTPEMNDGNYLVSKETPAVAAPVFSPDGGGFMGETDVTISCATASSAIYYTLDGSAPSKSSTLYNGAIHLTATTTINAIAFVGDDASLVISKTFTLTAPMTVSEALTALDSENPINNAAVAGIVSTAPTSNPSSGKLTYYISDDGTDTDELEVFLGFGLNGASFSNKTDLQVGDEVTVFGNLTIFNSTTKEFASGSRLLAFNRPQVDVESINLTESTASVEKDKTVTLHASVVPANATNKTIVWSVQSGNAYASVNANGVVTGIAAGEAVIRAASDEDATIFAECTVTVTAPAPLSPWASVYTSNVELSGSQNVKVTITVDEEDKNFDGVKMNKAAAATFTIPAGTTNLYAHMAAWNGEAQTVTVSGDCFDADKSIDIVADANISGSGTTYDIDDAKAPTDYFKEIVLDKEVTEPTEITITAASGKRFVLFGVNQVGGIALESIAISGIASNLEYNDGDHFNPAGLVVTGHYSNGSDAAISDGIDWAFDPDPLTEGTTSVSVTATAGGFTSTAFVVDGLTVAGAAPLSPWASVYTSNVEIASNTAAHVTINGEDYDAAKTSKGASATITLPQGVTTIHLHLVAWNGEAQTVSVTGDCFNEAKELSIEANAGVSGSGTTYDLGESGTNYYFSLTPDNEVAANEVITITAASNKRFVLFGVNQEGGVVPVLDHIAITGTMTNTTGWKTGDHIIPEGLTVNAYYTLNEVEQAPVDVTSSVVWSHAALVADQTEVTLTATYTENEVVKSANANVTIDAVETGDPQIITDPASYLNFGSSVEKDAVVAPKTITVTLKNIAGATATLGGTNYSAFSIDDTEIVDGDVITVSVNTGTPGVYAGTVTIKDNDSETQKVITLSMTVLEPEVPETAVSTTSKWVPATEIANGMQVLITGVKDEVTYAMGGQNNNNRAAVAGTLNEGVFTPGENTMAFTVVAQGDGTYALRTSNGQYLYAASSSKNYLRTQEDVDANAKWTLTVSSAAANGANTNNTMFFNGTNNPKIFSCYASSTTTQLPIQLYVPQTPEPPVEDWVEVRNGLTEGWYYTMCLTKAVTAVRGASIWRVLSKAENGTDIILEEVIGTLAAGRPYIFYAMAATLEVVYTGDAVGAPVNDETNNGLIGSFSQAPIDNVNTNYILYNNELYYVNTNNVYVGEYRAYLNMNDVPNYTPSAPVPGRRYVSMRVHAPTIATGLENAEQMNDENAVRKVLINGQIYILRGEKMYDATGRLVK